MNNPTVMEHERDVEQLRRRFPMLATTIGELPFAYLDNGATTQKPRDVIERMREFDSHAYATVHRGSYELGERATAAYEEGRATIARFIGADADELVVTSGATAALNLVARSWGDANLAPGDTILVTGMEHHANIVPWQMTAQRTGATLAAVPLTPLGDLDRETFRRQLRNRVKVVAVTQVSNVLGTINPLDAIIREAHAVGAIVVVDGAQGVGHMPTDVKTIDADFYAFSGHKMYGPTGVGALYGKRALLAAMPPLLGGGDMIRKVTLASATYADPPQRFEAGTPPITGLVGMAEAVRFIEKIGFDFIKARESHLSAHLLDRLGHIDGVTIHGFPRQRAPIVSFSVEGAHPHDVVTLLDADGLALRGGHHCAQPLMETLGVPATTRASLAFYNTDEEIERLGVALTRLARMFA